MESLGDSTSMFEDDTYFGSGDEDSNALFTSVSSDKLPKYSDRIGKGSGGKQYNDQGSNIYDEKTMFEG
jgi:hypothetical protein